MIFRFIFPVVTLALLCALTASGGDNPLSVVAVRTSSPPLIDGAVTEAEWLRAAPATGFIQYDPLNGEKATEISLVRVLYDDDALYFGCQYADSDPSGIVSRLVRRDNETESDMASIRIDSYHDSRTAFEFTFNVAGVKVDIIQYDDGEQEDNSWDVVWDVRTRITGSGWEAEVRIPFSVLRYSASASDTAEQVWGINFVRYITRKKELDRWAHVSKSESGFVSRFGHLRGLRGIPSPHRVEILPFTLVRQAWTPATDIMGRKSATSIDGGVDLKVGIGSGLTLDATVNPDFGQVEADPAVLNLSTFETFYPERRPFFIEGMQIIRFPTFGGEYGPGMFYSRRIGRGINPEEAMGDDVARVESVPQHVTILGAAKLSGRLTGSTSIGVLEAVTRREYAKVLTIGQEIQERLVEPEAHYNVIRVKQDVLTGSSVGGILTSVARNGKAPALTAGLDWDLRLWQATHRLDGFLAASHATDGDGQRISGGAGRIQLQRTAAVHWLWSTSLDFTTPRYTINDVGYFRRPSDYGGAASLTYKEDQPAAVVRAYEIKSQVHERWTFEKAHLNREFGLDAAVQFDNYWQAGAEFSVDLGRHDDRETRGNGLYLKPREWHAELSGSTDDRKVLAFGMEHQWGWDEHGRRAYRIGAILKYKPLSWTEWQVDTEFETVRKQEAWMTNTVRDGQTLSLFGDRNTDMASMTLRGEVTFTRDLTLQLYGQLFLAKGSYASYRAMVAPGTFAGWQSGLNPQDFNEKALHTNAVLRWEYLPGSTLYLVWSQARNGTGQNARTVLDVDITDAFRLAPSNVLLLKVTYWWNV